MAIVFVAMGFATAFADPEKPEPVGAKPWFKEHLAQVRTLRAAPPGGVVFLGDSLTAFWTTQGVGSWTLDLKEAGFSPVNLGIAAGLGNSVSSVVIATRSWR